MTRAELATYLANTHGALLSQTGIAATDTAGALKEPLDDALLALGTAYAEVATATIANADAIAARKLGSLTVLGRIYQTVLGWTDITVGDPNVSKRRSQVAAQVKEALALASAEAAPYLTTGGEWSAGTITIGHLEPEPVS